MRLWENSFAAGVSLHVSGMFKAYDVISCGDGTAYICVAKKDARKRTTTETVAEALIAFLSCVCERPKLYLPLYSKETAAATIPKMAALLGLIRANTHFTTSLQS